MSSDTHEIRVRWLNRLNEWQKLHVHVDGAELAREVLSDIDALTHGDLNTPLSLVDAARESGYTATHLGREVRAGRIPNAGRENAPKILRRDLPRKIRVLPQSQTDTTFSRERIARAVATSNKRVSDG